MTQLNFARIINPEINNDYQQSLKASIAANHFQQRVKVPATGGEFWQGYINNKLVLVNCPIDYFAHVEAKLYPSKGKTFIPKGFCLLEEASQEFNFNIKNSNSVEVKVLSAIPRGLGMASSTTELAALTYVMAKIHNYDEKKTFAIVDQLVKKFDSGIDGNYRQGINLVSPTTGEKIFQMPRIPKMKMLLFNSGGSLDTHSMDREKEKSIAKKYAHEMENSYAMLIKGFLTNDLRAIGQAATQNSMIYQKILAKPKLEKLLQKIESFGIYGLTTGHSGTVVGVLAPLNFNFSPINKIIYSLYGLNSIIGEHNLISGGFYDV